MGLGTTPASSRCASTAPRQRWSQAIRSPRPPNGSATGAPKRCAARSYPTRGSPSAHQQRSQSAPLPLGLREPDECDDRRHPVVSTRRQRAACSRVSASRTPSPTAFHLPRQPPTQLPSCVCPRDRLASRHSCWPVSGLGWRGEASAAGLRRRCQPRLRRGADRGARCTIIMPQDGFGATRREL